MAATVEGMSAFQLTHNGAHTCDIIAVSRTPVVLHICHRKAGRDKPLERNACCLCMHERGRRGVWLAARSLGVTRRSAVWPRGSFVAGQC
jgi:hypothetical protein